MIRGYVIVDKVLFLIYHAMILSQQILAIFKIINFACHLCLRATASTARYC